MSRALDVPDLVVVVTDRIPPLQDRESAAVTDKRANTGSIQSQVLRARELLPGAQEVTSASSGGDSVVFAAQVLLAVIV